jgi:Fe-S-cluster containining protein
MKFFEAISKIYGKEIRENNLGDAKAVQIEREVDGVTFLYPKGITFSCQRCGNCCYSDVPLDRDELNHFNFETKRGSEHAFSLTNLFLAKKPDNHCVYLEQGGCSKCLIYKDRPNKCRTFPWIESPGHLILERRRVFILYVDKEHTCEGFFPGEMTDEILRQFTGPLMKPVQEPEPDAMQNADFGKLLQQAIDDAGLNGTVKVVKDGDKRD